MAWTRRRTARGRLRWSPPSTPRRKRRAACGGAPRLARPPPREAIASRGQGPRRGQSPARPASSHRLASAARLWPPPETPSLVASHQQADRADPDRRPPRRAQQAKVHRSGGRLPGAGWLRLGRGGWSGAPPRARVATLPLLLDLSCAPPDPRHPSARPPRLSLTRRPSTSPLAPPAKRWAVAARRACPSTSTCSCGTWASRRRTACASASRRRMVSSSTLPATWGGSLTSSRRRALPLRCPSPSLLPSPPLAPSPPPPASSCTSPAPRLHLACISPASRLHLAPAPRACTSPASQVGEPCAFVGAPISWGPADGAAEAVAEAVVSQWKGLTQRELAASLVADVAAFLGTVEKGARAPATPRQDHARPPPLPAAPLLLAAAVPRPPAPRVRPSHLSPPRPSP
jgi:hypothetical protein